MPQKPRNVLTAIYTNDSPVLAELGRRGRASRARKNKAKRRRETERDAILSEYKERLRIFESYQMSREAHEDIAPLT